MGEWGRTGAKSRTMLARARGTTTRRCGRGGRCAPNWGAWTRSWSGASSTNSSAAPRRPCPPARRRAGACPTSTALSNWPSRNSSGRPATPPKRCPETRLRFVDLKQWIERNSPQKFSRQLVTYWLLESCQDQPGERIFLCNRGHYQISSNVDCSRWYVEKDVRNDLKISVLEYCNISALCSWLELFKQIWSSWRNDCRVFRWFLFLVDSWRAAMKILPVLARWFMTHCRRQPTAAGASGDAPIAPIRTLKKRIRRGCPVFEVEWRFRQSVETFQHFPDVFTTHEPYGFVQFCWTESCLSSRDYRDSSMTFSELFSSLIRHFELIVFRSLLA